MPLPYLPDLLLYRPVLPRHSAGPGSGGSVGLFRRVQPDRAGGAVGGGATDPLHPAGHRGQHEDVQLRGHRAGARPHLLHLHHHEPGVRRAEERGGESLAGTLCVARVSGIHVVEDGCVGLVARAGLEYDGYGQGYLRNGRLLNLLSQWTSPLFPSQNVWTYICSFPGFLCLHLLRPATSTPRQSSLPGG